MNQWTSRATRVFVWLAFFAATWTFAASACAAEPELSLLFTSQGKTARINLDGSGLEYFDFAVPNQATWQPGPIFPDGRQLILLSMEPRRDGPGRPFEEYYTQTPTHIWRYDLKTGSLEELCTRERPAVFITPALLLDDGRMLIQVVKDGVGQICNVRLDGSDRREFTRTGEGIPYGLSLSPDGTRVAFHLASPAGYQVWTSDLNGHDRQLIAADPAASLLRYELVTRWTLDPVCRLPLPGRSGARLGRRLHRQGGWFRAPSADDGPGDVVRGDLR